MCFSPKKAVNSLKLIKLYVSFDFYTNYRMNVVTVESERRTHQMQILIF